MPAMRTRQMEDEGRRALLDEARQAFAREGFERASLNRILEAAGLSKGSFYYHFENKHDLFLAVVRDTVEPVMESVGTPPPAEDAASYWSGLESYMRASQEAMRSAPDAMGVLRAAAALMNDPEWRRAYEGMREETLGVARKVLEDGQRVGAVRTDLPLPLLAGLALSVAEQVDQWVLREWGDVGPEEEDAWRSLGMGLVRRVTAAGVDA